MTLTVELVPYVENSMNLKMTQLLIMVYLSSGITNTFVKSVELNNGKPQLYLTFLLASAHVEDFAVEVRDFLSECLHKASPTVFSHPGQ